MSLTNSFSTLCISTAVLATKTTFVHLLCARTRLMTGKLAQPEDAKSIANPIFQCALFCIGSDLGGEALIGRCERLAANCAQNEPFFLLLALSGELSGKVPNASGQLLIKVYCASRIIHTVAYIIGPRINSAFRSASFAVGAFTTLGYAALVYAA